MGQYLSISLYRAPCMPAQVLACSCSRTTTTTLEALLFATAVHAYACMHTQHLNNRANE
jgi:hypothetical protein